MVAPRLTRTDDLPLTRRLLYQLSYLRPEQRIIQMNAQTFVNTGKSVGSSFLTFFSGVGVTGK